MKIKKLNLAWYLCLDYLIDLRFQEINRHFVLSIDDNAYITSHERYSLQTVEIKHCKVMIAGGSFVNHPIRNDRKPYKGIRKTATGRLDKYTTKWLLDSPCFKNSYKPILIDLS